MLLRRPEVKLVGDGKALVINQTNPKEVTFYAEDLGLRDESDRRPVVTADKHDLRLLANALLILSDSLEE